MKHFKKFQIEEMYHHDREAIFYAKRNEKDYIWEIPAKEFLLSPKYIKPGFVVVDMGCGPAILIKKTISKSLIRKIHYTGVDISKNMLKIAQNNIPNGRFIQDDMETVKIKKNSVDVVISLGALHHSQNKTRTLKNWFSILKTNGLILMREPTKEVLKKGQGESPNEEGVDINEIKKFIKKNNGKLIDLKYFWSPLFHIVNKILIKARLEFWRNSKVLWKLFLYTDILTIMLLKRFYRNFNGDSVAIVIQKNESINN